MKTAIIFTGFVRSFFTHREKLSKNLLNCFGNDLDLYFCSWDTIDLNNKTKIDESIFKNTFPNYKKIKIYNWEEEKEKIKKTSVVQRINDVLKTNKYALREGVESTNRIRNQWYLINLAKKMIPSGYYDTIVRTRFDLLFSDVSIKKIKSGITIPYNFYTHYVNKNYDIDTGFCDHLAYGDENSMMKYLSLYEHFDDMYINQNANIAHAEGILKYYLTKYNKCDINMNDNILYYIIKNEKDINRTPMIVHKYWTAEDYWSPSL